MAFDTTYSGTNNVSVGDPTEKADYDQLLDNTIKHEAQIASFRRTWVQGLQVYRTNSSEVTIAAGAIMDTTLLWELSTGSTLVLDLTTTGALGLDTGALANSTEYHVYIAMNSSTGAVTGYASTSDTFAATTKPSGYDKGRWLGSFWTTGAAVVRKMEAVGTGLERWQIFWDQGKLGTSPFSVFSGTSASSGVQASSFSGIAPSNATVTRTVALQLGWEHDQQTNSSVFRIFPHGGGTGVGTTTCDLQNSNDSTDEPVGGTHQFYLDINDTGQNVDWQMSNHTDAHNIEIWVNSICITLEAVQ
jgi:hypothetical protein